VSQLFETVLFQFNFNVCTVLVCSIPLRSRVRFSWWEAWGPGISSI